MGNKNLLLKSAKNLKGTLRQFFSVALLGDKSADLYMQLTSDTMTSNMSSIQLNAKKLFPI